MVPGPRTVVHLAPHPDDEALGAPALLLALRAAGHRVVNVACSLGRTHQHARRRSEVQEACRRAGFELLVLDPPVGLSRGDASQFAHRSLVELVRGVVDTMTPDLVVAPSPHDGHPGHEVVGRAARDVLAAPGMPRLWLWGLWADLPLPTLFHPFGDVELEAAVDVLRAHAGEVARNDFVELLRCRAVTSRVLGSERVFGFGQPARLARCAELLTEVAFAAGEWWAGAPREPDMGEPLTEVPRDRPLGWWMNAPSFAEQLASHVDA